MRLNELTRMVAASAHDSQFHSISEALYHQFIDESVDDLRSKGWLLPLEEDTSINLAANTYIYAIPDGYAYIRALYLADSEGDFSIPMPFHQWAPRYDVVANAVYAAFGEEFHTAEQFLGDVAANTRIGQGFRSLTAERISQVQLYMYRVGSPTDNLTMTIETDTSGAPSGTTVTNGTSDTVSGSGLQTSLNDDAWVTFTFDPPAIIASDTAYHLAVARSTAVDASNYYSVAVDQEGRFSRGAGHLRSASAWGSDQTWDVIFRLRSARKAGPVLRFNKLYWSPNSYAGRNIKLIGQRRPPRYVNDTDEIQSGFEGFLRERASAKAMLYLATVPIDSSDPDLLNRQLAVVNQRVALANAKLQEAERMLASHPSEFRVKPNSRHVPGR